jgi:hypothetical protein
MRSSPAGGIETTAGSSGAAQAVITVRSASPTRHQPEAVCLDRLRRRNPRRAPPTVVSAPACLIALAYNDLDAPVLRLTNPRAGRYQQVGIAETLNVDRTLRHAVLGQFGGNSLRPADR